MGLLPTLHRKVFNAIHNERARLRTPEDLAAFATKNGVDPMQVHRRLQLVLGPDQGAAGAPDGRRRTRSMPCRRWASTAATTPTASSPTRRPPADRTTACWRSSTSLIAQVRGRAHGPSGSRLRRAAAAPHSGTKSRQRLARSRGIEWPARFMPLLRTTLPRPPALRADPRSLPLSPPALAALLALASAAGVAEKADRFKPLNVEADLPGKIDLLKQYVVFNGNVVVTKGTMMIRASADRGARDARRLPHRGRLRLAEPARDLPPEARRARRVHRRRRRAARVRRQVRRHPLRQQRLGAAPARQRDQPTRSPATWSPTTAAPRSSPSPAARRRRRPTRAAGCARC